jgi:hypothetical protein
MPAHTFTASDGGVPLNDVDMDDLNKLAEALPETKALPKQTDECDNMDTSNDATQAPPPVPAAHSTQDHEDEAMDGLATAVPAETKATPNDTPGGGDDEAARLRLELFTSMFAGRKVELKNLATPPQCAEYPAQAEDIRAAYLDYTTFTVKVWTNFDPVQEVFFEGARAADCGKPQVPKARLEDLLKLDTNVFNFPNIRLEIGTPFRSLAIIRLNLDVKDDSAYFDIGGMMLKQSPPRRLRLLQSYLGQCVDRLREAEISQNLDITELVAIAGLFRRERGPDDEEDGWEHPAYGGGEWAVIETPPRSWFTRNSQR